MRVLALPSRPLSSVVQAAALSAAVGMSACGQEQSMPEAEEAAPTMTSMEAPLEATSVADLLRNRQAVFGIFSGEKSAEQGAIMAANRETDFVFYSLEQGPFDLETMAAYTAGMRTASEAAGHATHPLALRIPPIGDDPDRARERVAAALEAGAESLVFPHVTSGAEAALAVEAMGGGHWPGNPGGGLTSMLIVEDQEGIANVRDIVGTEGVSVVFAGPGDLRRAYEGDMEAVETAIQSVLAACREFDVACGITAGVDDIAMRLEQGFRVIIVTDPAALGVGRDAAGR